MQSKKGAEVALAIIRILESLRQNRGVTREEAFALVRTVGLKKYLASLSGDDFSRGPSLSF